MSSATLGGDEGNYLYPSGTIFKEYLFFLWFLSYSISIQMTGNPLFHSE
jgi:hypothetical protein